MTVASPSSSSSSRSASINLPSLQPLSHEHPLLTADTFDADAFLLSRVHIPLDELRGELREYLSVLREELVQLINDDYEEFISLGTGLRGERDRLRKLQQPLAALCLEVEKIHSQLVHHQSEIQARLDERTALRDQKATLDLLARLFDILGRIELLPRERTTARVSRIANEYAQLVYLTDKAESEGCKAAAAVTTQIKNDLLVDLSTLLLSDPSCLRVYDALGEWEAAEEIVRADFKAACRQIVAPANLLSSMDDTQTGDALSARYNHLYDLVVKYVPLFDPTFHFLEEVILPEIISAILNLNGIFAAGRPDELHKNFIITQDFITRLEELAPSVEVVGAMRESAHYERLEKAWQLPVYFQLRWKEIIACLDETDKGEFQLPESAGTWKALEKCKSSDVVLRPLAPRFFRLSLQVSLRRKLRANQIIARYRSILLKSLDDIDYVCAALADSRRFNIGSAPFEDAIVNILSQRCNESLKMVRSVASQFRATTKTQNNQPSFFVPTVLKPLHQFLDGHSGENVTNRVVDSVFASYGSILASVRKTEDLLRRHRKSKKTGFSLFGTPADVELEEERFNLQMLTDVEALAKDARGLKVDVDGMNSWKELLEVCRTDLSGAAS